MSASSHQPFIDQRSRKKRPKYVARHAGSNNIRIRLNHNWTAMLKLGADPVWGSVVGEMFMEGVLAEAEADAAVFYAEVVGRFDRYHPNKDGSLPHTAQAQSYNFGARAADTEIERHNRHGTIASYERRAKKIRKLWEKVQIEVGSVARDRVDQLCLLDQRPPEASWQVVKDALLRVARRFLHGSHTVGHTKKPPMPEKRAEALYVLVLRAIASIQDKFKVNGGRPEAFEIVAAQHELGIRVHGIDRDGNQMSDCVMVKLRKGDLAEQVALLFLKQCEVHEWKDHRK